VSLFGSQGQTVAELALILLVAALVVVVLFAVLGGQINSVIVHGSGAI